MICRTCLQRAAAISRRAPLLRAFSTSIPTRNAAAAAAGTAAAKGDPALSTPMTSPGDATSPGDEPEADTGVSSCKPGTVLNGLNYFKGKQDPVALPDNEYPAWLWRCLEVQEKAAVEDADATGDEFSKSKKQRRLAAKRQRLLEAKLVASGDIEALAPKIPLQQQSINLPSNEEGSVEGAILASGKREELRQAMRKERKAKIKEANYLKSM